MSIFDDIKHTAEGVGRDVSHTGHQIEGGVMQVEHAVQNGVLQIQQETEKGLHRIKGALPDIEEYVQQGLRTALEEFEKALAGPLLKTMVKLLEVAAPDTIWQSIGPFTFTIGKVPDKIERLRHYANNPPDSVETIKQFIEDLAPDDIEVSLKVNVPGTQSLTLGSVLVYYPKTFRERLDEIWKEVT